MAIRIYTGDFREVLRTLPDASVQCCVTSPPYYGLRDYGTAQWDGGDAGCDHVSGMARNDERTIRQIDADSGRRPNAEIYASDARGAKQYRDTCGKCGARRIDAQIGLEQSPNEYLAQMVAVFRDVRRVLRDDGTCWVNIGDAYAHGLPSGTALKGDRSVVCSGGAKKAWGYTPTSTLGPGLKPKDLLMMPARLALALQADGWWIRSDIIWHKPNPMPESVTDRPTSAHEHVFLLTKSPRYFYDCDAVREPISESTIERWGDNPRRKRPNGAPTHAFIGGEQNCGVNPAGRNCRNVWTISTEAFPSAHFATFPTALAERCIRAGTSERGCCGQCGAPWVRLTDREQIALRPNSNSIRGSEPSQFRALGGNPQRGAVACNVTTAGWAASCGCLAPKVACTVLDPFAGAGTTLLVADRLQRNGVGIELNPTYAAMARNRVVADAGMFAEVAD